MERRANAKEGGTETYEWALDTAQSFISRESIYSPRDFIKNIMEFKSDYDHKDVHMVQELKHMLYAFVNVYPIPGVLNALLSVDKKFVVGFITYEGIRHNAIPHKKLKRIYKMIRGNITPKMLIPWICVAIRNSLHDVFEDMRKHMDDVYKEISLMLKDYKEGKNNINIPYANDFMFLRWITWAMLEYLKDEDIEIIYNIAIGEGYHSIVFSLEDMFPEIVENLKKPKIFASRAPQAVVSQPYRRYSNK